MLLDLTCNTFLVELVLLNATGVGQPRRIEDANLGKRLRLVNRNTGAYYYAVVAFKLVKAGRVGLTLVVRTTLLVSRVKDFIVVVTNVFANKDIGQEFQDG